MTEIEINVRAADPFPVRCPEGTFWLNLAAVRRIIATCDGRCCVEWKAGGRMIVEQHIETLTGAIWRANVAEWRRKRSDLPGSTGGERGEIRMNI